MIKFKYKKLLYYFLIFLGLSSIILYFDFNKKYLIFNLGLSFIPYILTSYTVNNKDKYVICTVLILASILFYPNAIYMFTDLTHIKTADYYSVVKGHVMYNMDYTVWLRLSVEVAMVFLSMILSFESFVNIIKTVNCYTHKFASAIILVFFSGITGFAVYIGRFLRFNSWDFFKLPALVSDMIVNLNQNDFFLIGIFSVFHLIILIILFIMYSE